VSNWSEPGAVKINRDGKLLGPSSAPERGAAAEDDQG
jgi:hypothetical protein